ncbi:MAG: alkaline phosphatase PhoX [Pseudohongiellaceae bacterium]
MKDPFGICDVPRGFTYRIVSQVEDTMSDGLPVPPKPDGMGCFPGPDGGSILVRNHEISASRFTDNSSPVPGLAYDPMANGGTTTIWLDRNLNVIRQYLSLTGTIRNCSGGATPWGTWISSEEAGGSWMLGPSWVMGERHGYNFEVDPQLPLQRVESLRAMGRFNHEAVAVDPVDGVVYQTEDDPSGCFYRFIPNEPGKLANGGLLQALRILDGDIMHTTRDELNKGTRYHCGWVNIEDPDPEGKDGVRNQAQQQGAAIFVRGEGICIHADGIYFACTSGGSAGIGQIFRYVPDRSGAGGTLELIHAMEAGNILEHPDNLTVNRWGDLIICEDNSQPEVCLAGLTGEGHIYYIASNPGSEWCGVCFSPDGETLFANIFDNPGMTVAISGPWEALREPS